MRTIRRRNKANGGKIHLRTGAAPASKAKGKTKTTKTKDIKKRNRRAKNNKTKKNNPEEKVKKTKSDNYAKALAVLDEANYVYLNTVEPHNEEGNILPSKQPSPEEIVIKVDLYNKLSEEAKEVIDTILNGPKEVLELFASPVQKSINVRRVQKYYERKWQKTITRYVIKEIRHWISQLKSK